MKTLFLPNNAPGVNWWRQIMFFKYFQDYKLDSALYGYIPKENEVAKWENLYEADKLCKGIRTEIHQLMRWCDTAIIGYARYPSTIAMIEMFKSTKPEDVYLTNGSKKIVCDIDDFVEDTPTYNPAYKSGWKPSGMYGWVAQEHMRLADVVINATEWLADEHKVFNKNSIVIPNCIDESIWNVKIPPKTSKKIRIGWIGGGNHDEDFRVLPRVIEAIQSKYKNVEFYFVHGAPSYIRSMKGVRSDNRWNCIEKYPQMLASYGFDIGLAPLDYNRFNAGKSNLKFLEYSILGIPGVYSDYEPYKCIKNEVDGFKVTKIAEWIDRLSQLIESEYLRVDIGQAAKRRVLADYNVKNIAKDYIKVLEGL